MKNKIIEKLIDKSKTEIDYSKKEVSVNLIYKSQYIISKVNVENDIYDIETNVNLREVQEDMVINYLTDVWNMHFANSFANSIITQEDRLHAESLLYN